ncbi:hypothetical protein RCL1_005181 [Eukaryota sp. TZLM3-RCL]
MASSDDELSVKQFPLFLGLQFESKDALKVAVLSYCTSTEKSNVNYFRNECSQLTAKSFGLRKVDNGVFEVVDGIKTFDADMNNKTCSYHHWQDLGTPCEHVMRVLRNTNDNPEKYFDEKHFIENYRKTYESRLLTVNNADVLKEEKVNKMEPPKEIVPVGRPAIARKRKGHEGGAPKPKKVNTNKARCDKKE